MTIQLTHADVLSRFGVADARTYFPIAVFAVDLVSYPPCAIVPLGQQLHQEAIDALTAANFMAVHSIFSVQTICMLIHVGYNMGQSDLIGALMGSAIRIAQSLGLHRLGPDRPPDAHSAAPANSERAKRLVAREVMKRVWWFIVRQDWLQISFLNTYTIHASQFNTPMPINCLDRPDEMVRGGSVVELDVDTYTQGSYTSVFNHGKHPALSPREPSLL